MSPRNKTFPILILLFIFGSILLLIGYWFLSKDKDYKPNPVNKIEELDNIPPSEINELPEESDNTPSSEINKLPEELDNTSPRIQNFSQINNVPQGKFLYGGSTTWAPIREEVDSQIKKILPNFKIQYTDTTIESGRTPGSGTGIRMLLENELDFSQSSRQIKEKEFQEAKKKGYSLKQVPVAIDAIAIAVNPKLDIEGLTLEQLKGIYTGKITNWSEVGGPNLKITPYSRSLEDAGTVNFFIEKVIKSNFSTKVKFSKDTTTGFRLVANDIGSIYYASASEVVPQCIIKPLPIGITSDKFIVPYLQPYIDPANCPRYRNRLNFDAFQNKDYPLTRQLYVIVKENGEIEEQVGTIYADLLLTIEGQKLIEKAGFVPLGLNEGVQHESVTDDLGNK